MEKSAEDRIFDLQDTDQVSGGDAENSALREPGIHSYVDNYSTRKVSREQIEKGIISGFGIMVDEAREKTEKDRPENRKVLP